MALFSLFLVFFLWILGKLCYMLLLHMKNKPVLTLLCYIDLLFLVVPHLVFCVHLVSTVKCRDKIAGQSSVECLLVLLVNDVTYSRVILVPFSNIYTCNLEIDNVVV